MIVPQPHSSGRYPYHLAVHRLLTPPRVFMDTWSLSQVLQVQRDGQLVGDDGSRAKALRSVYRCISDGTCTPVYCEALAGEWVRHADAKRPDQYARLLDRCDRVFEFDPMPGLPLAECLNECGRIDPDLGLPVFEMLRPLGVVNPLLVFVSAHHPDCPPSLANLGETQPTGPPPKASVGLSVQLYKQLQKGSVDLWSVGIEGDRIAFERTKATQGSVPASVIASERVIKHWITNGLSLKAILHSVSPTTDVDLLIASMDLTACPGTMFYYRVYDKYVRAKAEYDEPSDLVDQSYIPGLAYCDYALVDKRIRNFVEQAQRDGVGGGLIALSDVRDLDRALKVRLGSVAG